MSSEYKDRSLLFPANIWVIVASDLVALFLSCLLAYLIRLAHSGLLPLDYYLSFIPLLLFFPILFSFMDLYPGFFLHPSEELKRCFLCNCAGFLIVSTVFFLTKRGDLFSRGFILIAWLFALILVPYFRHRLRVKLYNKKWWRIPVIIIAESKSIKKVQSRLIGSNIPVEPVAYIQVKDDTNCQTGKNCYFLEDDGHFKLFTKLSEKFPKAMIVIDGETFNDCNLGQILDSLSEHFKKIIATANVSWDYCIPTKIYNLRGTFALAIRRNLADKKRLRIKRATDLFFSILGSLLLAPFFLVLIITIRLSLRSPALFKHRRVGRNGQSFMVYKFRTMLPNAQEVLKNYLNNNPEEKIEWEENQKLKNDPRITRLGAFLRKNSLDELPQLINVIKGEMSLVGPRPIVDAEVEKYGEIFQMYSHVKPGITGLWQVTGRNDTSYQERVNLDRYYVANWSMWLDIYILLKTIPAVLGKKGAY